MRYAIYSKRYERFFKSGVNGLTGSYRTRICTDLKYEFIKSVHILDDNNVNLIRLFWRYMDNDVYIRWSL